MAYELPVFCFCADMVRSIKLRREFDMDPYGVMTTYGLNQDAMEAVFTMFTATTVGGVETWQALWDYIWNNEVSTLVVEKLLPPPSDPDCTLPAFYPNPKPLLYTVTPNTAPTNSTNVNVVVKGQGLWKTATLILRVGGTDYPVLTGTPAGTYRCSHLTGALNMTGVPAGTNYDVVVRNVTANSTFQRECQHTAKFIVT